MAMLCRDALRMKLYAVHPVLRMLKPHDHAVIRMRGDTQYRRQALPLDGKAVIPGCLKPVRQSSKDALAIMADGRDFSVHWLRGAHDTAAKGLSYCLMTEAHS